MNPYEVLGVRKNASPQTVKKAYRKKAQEHHPDRGGDPDKFKEVHLAYKVLSDPKLREQYDTTGQMPGTGPDNSQAPVFSLLSSIYIEAMREMLSRGRNAGSGFLLATMEAKLLTQQREVLRQKNELEKMRNFIKDSITALAGQEGVLVEIFCSYLKDAEAGVQQLSSGEATVNGALTTLRGYKFTSPEKVSPYGRASPEQDMLIRMLTGK